MNPDSYDLPHWRGYLWHPLWSFVIILRSWSTKFFAIIEEMIQTSIFVILHVPCSVRLLLTDVLASKLHHSHSKVMWDAVSLIVFAKSGLYFPPVSAKNTEW